MVLQQTQQHKPKSDMKSGEVVNCGAEGNVKAYREQSGKRKANRNECEALAVRQPPKIARVWQNLSWNTHQ